MRIEHNLYTMLASTPKMKHMLIYTAYIKVSINKSQHEKKMLLKAGFFPSIQKHFKIFSNY